MDPGILDATGWALIDALVVKLAVFTVLMILGAFTMLLSRGIIPSLVDSHHLGDGFSGYRRILVVTGVVAFALAAIQLYRIVGSVLEILNPYYPRFGF